MIKQILLAGGMGSRLSVLLSIPKQFYKFFYKNNKLYSTFMLTLERSAMISDLNDIIVLINEKFLNFATEQILELFENDSKKISIIVERSVDNTMISTYRALKFVKQYFADEFSVLVISCDHVIVDIEKYKNDLSLALCENSKSKCSIFGIESNNFFDSEKYGNILLNDDCKIMFYEKPKLEFLRKILNEGYYSHLWNLGIFLFNIDFALSKLFEIFNINFDIKFFQYKKLEKKHLGLEKKFFFDHNILDLQKLPIDLLISKILDDVKIVKCNFDWIDIGSPEKIQKFLVN